jgi:hypothetical protein
MDYQRKRIKVYNYWEIGPLIKYTQSKYVINTK